MEFQDNRKSLQLLQIYKDRSKTLFFVYSKSTAPLLIGGALWYILAKAIFSYPRLSPRVANGIDMLLRLGNRKVELINN